MAADDAEDARSGPAGGPVPQDPPWGPRSGVREPLFNAPWPPVLILAVILAAYALQVWVIGDDAMISALGFAPADLDHGRWYTLVSLMIVHGGWAHAIMNGLSALAFGAPVARFTGTSARGAAVFFGFFLICGVLSSLGYAAMHLHQTAPAVGASGAISGLMGAASRLMFGQRAGLSPIFGRSTVSFGLAWIIANALLAGSGVTPLMAGARIAWEAHIAEFVVGVLLIGPAGRLSGADDRAELTGAGLV